MKTSEMKPGFRKLLRTLREQHKEKPAPAYGSNLNHKIMTHEKLKENAIEAIRELHGDTSVPMEKTLDSLEEVRGEATSLIQMVKDELGYE